jgi:uncharacterized membrane protein
LNAPPPQHRSRLRLSRTFFAATLIFTALTIVRFNQSLWSDEASSVWFSRYPIASLLTTLCDPHPPGYYVLLKFWTIVGDHEAWLRLSSLIAGWGALFMTYRLGKDRWGMAVANLAVWLLALQPLQSWYASEVRMYALVQALGVLAVWLGWRLLANSTPRQRDWWAYVAVAAFALWVDYSAILPLLVMQMMWLAIGHPRAARWLGAQAAAALPIVLLSFTSPQLTALGNNIYSIFVAVQATRLGLELTPATAAALLQAAVIGGTLACLIGAGLWPRLRRSGLARWTWTIGLLWIGVLLLSAGPQAFTLKRRLVLLLPYLALITAVVAVKWPRSIQLMLIGGTALAAVLSLFTLQREPWRDTVQQLATAQSGSSVIWVDEMSVPAFDYYWQQNAAANQAAAWTTLFDQDLPGLPSVQPPPNGDLWLVTAETTYRHLNLFLPNDFRANYQLLDERHAIGIGVYHYRRQPSTTVVPPPDRSLADTWGLLLLSPLDTCAP